MQNIEAIIQRCSVKKMFLKISPNSKENTCVRVSFNKVAGMVMLPFNASMQKSHPEVFCKKSVLGKFDKDTCV